MLGNLRQINFGELNATAKLSWKHIQIIEAPLPR